MGPTTTTHQNNCRLQGSVVSPLLFNIYKYHICITAHNEPVDGDLGVLAHYYRTNSLQANPDKTKVTAFHLRNKEAKRLLRIKWNNSDLENTASPKYLSVTQNRTPNYKETYRKQIGRWLHTEQLPEETPNGEQMQVKLEQQH